MKKLKSGFLEFFTQNCSVFLACLEFYGGKLWTWLDIIGPITRPEASGGAQIENVVLAGWNPEYGDEAKYKAIRERWRQAYFGKRQQIILRGRPRGLS